MKLLWGLIEYEPKPKREGFRDVPLRIRAAVALATLGAYAFLILFCLQFVGNVRLDFDVAYGAPGEWFRTAFAAALNFLPLLPLLAVSLAIIRWSKVWVTFFADTPMADWVCKWGSLALGLLASLVIIIGSLSVNQETRTEDYRAGLNTQQAAEQNKTAIQEQIDDIDKRLAQMTNKQTNNEYAAAAANVGVARYTAEYLSEENLARETPARRLLLRRALGAAQTADELRANKNTLIAKKAAAPTAAASAAQIEMKDDVSKTVEAIGPWRMVFLTLVVDLILILGPYFADRYERRAASEQPAEKQDDTDPDKIKVRGHDRVRTKQRRLRPATAEELAAARGEILPGTDPKPAADAPAGDQNSADPVGADAPLKDEEPASA